MLSEFRGKLRELGIDAFIVGSGDAHQSEYVHASDKRRQFISGFSGSAGTALITMDSAFLWTDGRYFLQASQQLSADWTLMKSGEPGVPELNAWILANMQQGQKVGVDPNLVSASEGKAMEKAFLEKGIVLFPVPTNPVDSIWKDRPAVPSGPICVHESAVAGQPFPEKVAKMQEELSKQEAAAMVVCMLDEVAWLLNIRGTDVLCCPVVISYAVVTSNDTHLFVDEGKVTAAAKAHLDGVTLHSYSEIESYLSSLKTMGSVLADPAQLNWKLYIALGESIKETTSLLSLPKSIKNDAEIKGMKDAHVRDGAALFAFLCWLRSAVRAAPNTISEYDVCEKIEEFRGKGKGHLYPSFDTIAGYGPNGAIIHYKPDKESAAMLGIDSTFLLDSGGQYLDGTTDVTRTVHFGEPSQRMKECFTLVLKGHIGLASVVFPEGTVGSRLDSLARMGLWAAGLDYNHGTGHGVGAYLNVHEGPQGISFRHRPKETGFVPGMNTSNEPGYYEEGNFGIRIENICNCVAADTQNNFNGKKFCKFETMTMCPIQTSLIEPSLLTDAEITWLNAYHAEVREKLQPFIEESFPDALSYLIAETEPLSK